MNNSRTSFLATAAVVALLGSACGGDSKENPAALCKQGCTKAVALCSADAGAAGATLQALCEMACSSMTMSGGKPCSNASAMIAAYKACQSKTTCDEYSTCGQAIPACQGGAGSGGASGSTGGASGSTGGASGSTGGASGGGGRAGTGGVSGGGGRAGTGGVSGGGGRAGTGGVSGGGGASGGTGCANLLACCNATTNAQVKAICMTYYSTVMAMGDAACTTALTMAKQAGACP